jgi:class 3 adenylate cyclase/tetratricopeptide (TPR) repeat protein
MKCTKCHVENPDDAEFCIECGSTIEFHCPKCGTITPASGKFCKKCGHDLKEPKPAPPIDYSEPQSYTPKFLADKILDTRSSIEGERKLVTVLFADVANYTSMSEKLDPEEVHQIMDGCFKVLMDEIHRYEGTIDKFTGDGVMALFGAPIAHEDHAQRACYAALAIQRAMAEYSDKIEKDCDLEFKMRVGLNSGLVIVGSVGNDLRMDYTAIGDTTNLASRMETMAKPGAIMVSTDTYKITRDFFKFESLGKVEVKGKEEPLEAYQLIEAGEIETRIGAAVARGLTKFVGRKREIGALKEAFEKAQSGSGQVVGIVGEAGVGKSRLLLELKGTLRKKEHTYLEGRCLHYGGSMAYLPFLDILRAYFNIREGDREFIIKKKMRGKIAELDGNLMDILPPVQDILSLEMEDELFLKLTPPQKRDRTFEAIRDFLIRESENKPLILAVEDLHWIDRTSEDFLSYLIDWIANAHVLLILLYRPEYTHQWGSKSYYSQISVDQLSTNTSAELVQTILEEGEVIPELRELILGRTAGNPLFVEELTRTLLENGSIQRTDHQYVLCTEASEIQVPDTIQGIIAARMDRLEDNIKRTMQVASVIGQDFAYRILQTITGMREELKSYLLNLQGLEFIYEKSLFPELEYIFKHALTQEVAYNSLLLKRRKEIHERIGNAIEELYVDRLEEFYEVLAHHYSKSENTDKAYQYLKLSGEKASRNYSNWEALRFYKEALNILDPKSVESKRRGIDIRLLMDFPMIGLGYPEDSLQIIEQGEKLASELGDEINLAKIHSMIGCCSITQGNLQYGLKYNRIAYEEAEKLGDVDVMAPVTWDLCVACNWPGECLETVEAARKAIDLVESTQTEYESFSRGFNIYSLLLSEYSFALGMLGNFEEARAASDKALNFALEIDDLYALGWIELNDGFVSVFSGDGQGAIDHFRKAIKYLEETQNTIMLPSAWMGLGTGYRLMGDLETALGHMEKGFSIHEEIIGGPGLCQIYTSLGSVYCDMSNLNKAKSYLEEAVKLSKEDGAKLPEGMAMISLGRTLGKEDVSEASKAEEIILQGIKIIEELQLKPPAYEGYLYLADLYSSTGQEDKAQNVYRKMGLA